ncbi:MAG: hypothetical protein JXR49_06465 [Acidobacteria bacterium]|nr:hypothetical protein [Acidobacteriota bacterium]
MQTQEILLVIFTGILAVAVLMQTLIFFGMYKTFRRLVDRVDGISKDLLKNVDKVTVKAEETLATIQDIGNGFIPVKDKVVDAAEILHQRVVKVDDFFEETTDTARSEVEKMKDRIELAANRAEELLEIIHDGILVPVNEITAVTRGIRAGFNFLFKRRRNSSEAVRQSETVQQEDDEEMFI